MQYLKAERMYKTMKKKPNLQPLNKKRKTTSFSKKY